MYIPSYDFGLFDIDAFSELQANEFGAMTHFSANTPVSYVDFSLNQLYGLLNPNNPNPYISRQPVQQIIPRELQDFFAQKDSITVYPAGTTPPELQGKGNVETNIPPCDGKPWYWRVLGWCCPTGGGFKIVNGECTLLSDDSGVGTTNPSGDRVGDVTAKYFGFGNLPQNAGIFLIAIVVIVLLILFVRK